MSEHTHTAPDGTVYIHTHETSEENTGVYATAEIHGHSHTHSHTHTHDPKEIRRIVNRLSRSIGHLEAVKRMVEEGQDCADVLIQLAAVRSELNGTGKALLKQHLDHCIVEAVQEHDDQSIERINQAIDQFMK